LGEIVDGAKKAEYLRAIAKEGIHINQLLLVMELMIYRC
jgi:hypothetical protein